MLTDAGDSAHVRVKRTAVNPFENPDGSDESDGSGKSDKSFDKFS